MRGACEQAYAPDGSSACGAEESPESVISTACLAERDAWQANELSGPDPGDDPATAVAPADGRGAVRPARCGTLRQAFGRCAGGGSARCSESRTSPRRSPGS